MTTQAPQKPTTTSRRPRTVEQIRASPPGCAFDTETKAPMTMRDLNRLKDAMQSAIATLNDLGTLTQAHTSPSPSDRQCASRIATNLEALARQVDYTVAPDDIEELYGVRPTLSVVSYALQTAVGIDAVPYPMTSFGAVINHSEDVLVQLLFRVELAIERRLQDGGAA